MGKKSPAGYQCLHSSPGTEWFHKNPLSWPLSRNEDLLEIETLGSLETSAARNCWDNV
jgi:hypothetical protein